MPQFALFINEQVRGPLEESEIKEMIARGELRPDTLCAPAGSAEWEPLSNHFGFGSGLRVSRSRQPEAPVDAKEHPDLDQRRKLLVYGLADSVAVDQLGRPEAQSLIDAHEAKVRARIVRHRWAGIGGLAAGLALGAYVGLRTGADLPLTAAAEAINGKDDAAAARLRGLSREVAQFEKLKQSVNDVVFAKPTGGVAALGVLTARLKQDPAKSFRTSGQVSLAPLMEKASRWKVTVEGGPKVVLLPAPMPQSMMDRAAAQSEVLDAVLSPMLDTAKFEEMREELMRNFPEIPGNFDAERLKNEIRLMKVSELTSAAARVESRASFASTNSATAEWAKSLKSFAAKVRGLQDRIRINVDMQARRKLWSDHNAGPGAELAAWVLATGGKEVLPGADGSFLLDEGPRMSAADAARRILIVARINGDPVHLPWGSPFLTLGELRCEALPTDHFLLSERYKVVDKPVAGGRLHVAKLRVGGKELTVERRSPRWHYLSLAREKDPDSLLLLVDEGTHGRYATGDVVPAAEIIKGQLFLRPAESAVPPNLTLAP